MTAKKGRKRGNSQHKKALRRASPEQIEKSFGALKRHLPHSGWLPRGNRYREKTARRIESDFKSNSTASVRFKHVRDYIAASAPLHCIDGWGFLSAALSSHVQGAADISRHLAYYAELRAAMSLLATQGVGIFSKKHVIVDPHGKCSSINSGTHAIAWEALDHWAGLPRAVSAISDTVRPFAVPIGHWLDAFGPGSQIRPVSQAWLRGWGLDLKTLQEDRDARNEASYRPTQMVPRTKISPIEISKFVISFWRTHEPESTMQTWAIDRHLLRRGLETAFEAHTGNTPAQDPVEFENRVRSMCASVNAPGIPTDALAAFLTRQSDPATNPVVEQASRLSEVTDSRHHIQVICRATLLLRVATGLCCNLITRANYKRSELEFCWQEIGSTLGFWENAEIPESFIDLWADVEAALIPLEAWTLQNEHGTPSMRSFSAHKGVQSLVGCERIALWNLEL